jgi:hypothetical protein
MPELGALLFSLSAVTNEGQVPQAVYRLGDSQRTGN